MQFTCVRWSAIALLFCASCAPAWALNGSVPGIHGDVSRTLLGDGTGVIVGVVDSGVDDTHPTLAGLDSQGDSRLVAEKNFVTGEVGNTGDDVFGHGTWVAGILVGSDATYQGMAPDARYVNARVLDQFNGFGSDFQVRNGIGYAIDQGAQVLNLSMNYFATNSGGFSGLDLMIDWAAYAGGISTAVAVGNIPPLPDGVTPGNPMSVRSPGSAFNGISVGRTLRDYSKVSIFSAGAYTDDGRMKPDVVAPGTLLTLANDDWEGAAPDWDANLNGTSFATPHVAGLVAQMLEGGSQHGLSTDPLVVKTTIMNSASKSVLDRDFNAWEPASMQNLAGVQTTGHPLDPHSGAGQIDGARLATQYLAGEMAPGIVAGIGWDLNSVASGGWVDYLIDPQLVLGTTLDATLSWYRHVGRTDNGNGLVDGNDSFFVTQALSNLDLQILRNGSPIAASVSVVDNVEHLRFAIDEQAQYTIRVLGTTVYGGSEQFAVAWYGAAVPEPGSWALGLIGAFVGTSRRCWRRRNCRVTRRTRPATSRPERLAPGGQLTRRAERV